MRGFRIVPAIVLLSVLAACSTPEERAAKAQERSYSAQEEVAKQRLELVDKYQACVQEAGENKQKAEACESYLKAAEALK